MSPTASLLNAFYALRRGRLGYEEVYLDIGKNRVVPVQRVAESG